MLTHLYEAINTPPTLANKRTDFDSSGSEASYSFKFKDEEGNPRKVLDGEVIQTKQQNFMFIR